LMSYPLRFLIFAQVLSGEKTVTFVSYIIIIYDYFFFLNFMCIFLCKF
jgi:hypothetical protein